MQLQETFPLLLNSFARLCQVPWNRLVLRQFLMSVLSSRHQLSLRKEFYQMHQLEQSVRRPERTVTPAQFGLIWWEWAPYTLTQPSDATAALTRLVLPSLIAASSFAPLAPTCIHMSAVFHAVLLTGRIF